VNRTPSLTSPGNKTVAENAGLSFTLSASDPDGDTLTYSASNLPSGATFTASTRTFRWTPEYSQAGSYQNVLFTVTDNGDPLMSDYEEITITVGNVNRPPVLNPIGTKSIEEGKHLQFTITGTDPDGDLLLHSASNLPDGATFDPDTRMFSWTPGYDDAGNYQNVLFTVTDNGVPYMSDYEEITITVGNVNRPPILNPIGNKSIEEGKRLQFTVIGTDPDGDLLAYSASNLPDGATFDPDSQLFSWTPGYNSAGNYQNIRFTAIDTGDNQESAVEEITITVGSVNRPPVLNPIGNKNGNAGVLLQFVITANDPDGDKLVYSADNLPSGAGFNEQTQTFSWLPGNDQSGNYTVHFSVEDDGIPQEGASEDIIITVNANVITLIELSSFTAAPSNKAVSITWTSESEIDNTGFNIYRAESVHGTYIKINNALIPAHGAPAEGASYEFMDKDVHNRTTYYYKLEDIDLNDRSTFHGPISATPRFIYDMLVR